MFVSMKEIVDRAYAGKYAVPAVGGGNECMVRAAIEAAEETNSPLIIISGNRGVYDPMFYGFMVRYIANSASVPVALCLDHSPSFEDAMLGIRAGYSAVMVDRSMLPYEENVAQVKEIVKIAHSVGVTVEAELGHVGQGSNYAVDGNTALTSPEDAKRFIEETGVDCLAVAIGTAHGAYVGVPKLRFELLQQIDAACKTPLVLHGQRPHAGGDPCRKREGYVRQRCLRLLYDRLRRCEGTCETHLRRLRLHRQSVDSGPEARQQAHRHRRGALTKSTRYGKRWAQMRPSFCIHPH